jgi:diadenosine tetraphosphate (Ap4A) HIT family hydrolase
MALLNPNNARGDEQRRRMNIAADVQMCPFCPDGLIKIHQKPILKEMNGMFITESAFPYEGTNKHYLIIPKEHITNITMVTPENWIAVGGLMQWVEDIHDMHHGGLFVRFGDMSKTGSSVAHIHFQLLSGTKSESEKIKKSLKVKLGYK